MPSKKFEPRYQLYYWPVPFRGCFASYLFAYCGEALEIEDDLDEIDRLKNLEPAEQWIPFVGPPVLRDRKTDFVISQMPAIVLYVSRELDLLPQEPSDLAMGMKTLMDCNDLLMEICRYNGSLMWSRQEWNVFRQQRLPRWLRVFEESLKRGMIGQSEATFADIAVFALFGNMVRCLPELEADLLAHAPGIHALCSKVGSQPSLARFVADEERVYGKVYCGGQIEASIRDMLARDAAE